MPLNCEMILSQSSALFPGYVCDRHMHARRGQRRVGSTPRRAARPISMHRQI